MPKSKRQSVFVIMPFSGSGTPRDTVYWTRFFNEFLKKTFDELGYDCRRAEAKNKNIMRNVVGDLFNSEIVVAVLTDLNANVLYELGVRHSVAIGTIMITEKDQKIPFDLSSFGVVKYSRDDRQTFKSDLQTILLDRSMRLVPDSPVKEFLSTSETTLVRTSVNVAHTPLDTRRALKIAQNEVFIVGQNLFNLATHDNKLLVFTELEEKPSLTVKILIADIEDKYQVEALNQMIDEVMGAHLRRASTTFAEWLIEWRHSHPADAHRLQIWRSNRIGNVSATIVDREDEFGLILVRPIMYHSHHASRPAHWLEKVESPRIFDAYADALQQVWTHGAAVA